MSSSVEQQRRASNARIFAATAAAVSSAVFGIIFYVVWIALVLLPVPIPVIAWRLEILKTVLTALYLRPE